VLSADAQRLGQTLPARQSQEIARSRLEWIGGDPEARGCSQHAVGSSRREGITSGGTR